MGQVISLLIFTAVVVAIWGVILWGLFKVISFTLSKRKEVSITLPIIFAIAAFFGISIYGFIQMIFGWVKWEPPVLAFIYMPLFALFCAIGVWALVTVIVSLLFRRRVKTRAG